MNARNLHQLSDASEFWRWSASAVVIAALHAGAILAAAAWYEQGPPPGTTMPAILVDMAPVSTAPAVETTNLPPGPDMQQADAPATPPDPPKAEMAEQQIAATPPEQNPVVAAPPEQVSEQPTPPTPEPAKPQPDVVKPPEPVEKKPERRLTRDPSDRPPAPSTTAAPSAEKQAAVTAASRAGAAAAAAALPSYRDRLAAHLQRFKQYPGGAKAAREEGTAMLSFTVSRSGQVVSSRLTGSSGHDLLDAETLAMLRRAQPLPPFPSDLKEASMSFTVPVRFSLK